ncbi:hypothetical protein [Roseibium denhamense]|uniref:hypothetical protein n=1 Tax=Roseibium denhamense TaxID=76305 RepID=UPI0024B67189|nr:hypothetical protein [Roseibium denhamense]
MKIWCFVARAVLPSGQQLAPRLRFVFALPVALFLSMTAAVVRAEPVFLSDDQMPFDGAFARTACAVSSPDGVPVSQSAPLGVFQAADGSRYFASDVIMDRHLPLDDLAMPGPLIAVSTGTENRWGEVPAWILGTGPDAGLYQEQMLRKGAAIFEPRQAKGQCAEALWSAEHDARVAGRGLWSGTAPSVRYGSRTLGRLVEAAGRYVIVEGRIVSVGKTRSTRYLNFGRYWKEDFTATWPADEEAVFEAHIQRFGQSVDDLGGAAVEIRGTLQIRDGPYIALLRPEQLRLLETKRAIRDGRNQD